MAKILNRFIFTFCFIGLFGLQAFGQALTENQYRQRWFDIAKTYVGILEKTGRNDHDSIKVFNKYSKVALNSPYCASGMYYTAHRAGLDFKIHFPAGVKNWFADPKVLVWDRYKGARWLQQPGLMDQIWIYQSHIEALAQLSIPRDIEDDDYIMTIAFNTSLAGRQGVHYPLRRRWRDVRRVANHITPYLNSRR